MRKNQLGMYLWSRKDLEGNAGVSHPAATGIHAGWHLGFPLLEEKISSHGSAGSSADGQRWRAELAAQKRLLRRSTRNPAIPFFQTAVAFSFLLKACFFPKRDVIRKPRGRRGRWWPGSAAGQSLIVSRDNGSIGNRASSPPGIKY